MLSSIERESNSTGIGAVSFGFSNLHVLNPFNNERVKDDTVKGFLTEVDEEIDVVAAREFFTDKARVFGKGAKFTDKSFKALRIHRKFFFKDDVSRKKDSTSGETVFRDMNADEDFKVIPGGTSDLIIKAEKEQCLPILHDYEDYKAQPTYHVLGRGATNFVEGYNARVKWSCPSLPGIYLGKSYAYKV